MYYAIQTRSWGKSLQNGHLVGCLQQKSSMEWSRKLGGSIAGIQVCASLITIHMHVVHFSESVQHELKAIANCSW